MIPGTTFRISESVLGVVVLMLGLFIALETYGSPPTARGGMMSPQFFPYLIAFGLVSVGLMLLREAAVGHAAPEHAFVLDWYPVALIQGGLLLQILLLDSLGWVLASLPMFVAATLAFRELRLVTTVLIALALAGVTFVSFDYGLGLDLPVGSLLERYLPGEL